MIVKDRIYIGGQLVEPSGSTTIDVVNPFTEEVAGRVPEARKAYEAFFEFWRDADTDLPVMVAARQAYEQLGS